MFFLSRLRTAALHMYEPINMDALLLEVLASNLLKGSDQVTNNIYKVKIHGARVFVQLLLKICKETLMSILILHL